MVEISLIFPFSYTLDFDTIYVVDQDIVNFRMIPNTNLSTYDSFIWPYSHVDPFHDEPNKDTY